MQNMQRFITNILTVTDTLQDILFIINKYGAY